MTRTEREELRTMARSASIRRQAAKLTPPRIGRGRQNLTVDRYLDWLTQLSGAYPSTPRIPHRPERFKLP